MTITAAEVVYHAAPIAAMLGASIELRDCGTQSALLFVEVDGYCLDPEAAAVLILGMIVARIDTPMDMDYVGLMIQQVDSDHMRCATFDSKDRIGSRFKAFCHAFARAHGLSPAPTTEDTP